MAQLAARQIVALEVVRSKLTCVNSILLVAMSDIVLYCIAPSQYQGVTAQLFD